MRGALHRTVEALAVLFLMAVAPIYILDSSRAGGPTYVSGHITSDTQWSLANSPYVVTANVTVDSGATLSIEPGVQVRFDLFSALYVDGALAAIGTPSEPILFTSNLTPQMPGDWLAIKLNASASPLTQIRYCTLEWSANGIWIDRATPGISSVTISDPLLKGVYLMNSDSWITGVTVQRSRGTGVQIIGGSPSLSNMSISGAAFEGVFALGTNATLSGISVDGAASGIVSSDAVLGLTSLHVEGVQDGLSFDNTAATASEISVTSSARGLVATAASRIVAAETRLMTTLSAVYVGSSTLTIENSTAEGDLLDFQLGPGGDVGAINTTVRDGRLSVHQTARLVAQNFLTIRVEDKGRNPVAGAQVSVLDNGVLIQQCSTPSNGVCGAYVVTDRTYLGSASAIENSTSVEVSAALEFADNPRFVNMSASHTEVFRPPNLLPRVAISTPVDGETVWGFFVVRGNATDSDGRIVAVESRVGNGPWENMSIVAGTVSDWSYTWNSWTSENGTVQIYIRATDDEGGWNVSSISANVDNRIPQVEITSHSLGQRVRGLVTLQGRSDSLRGNITSVRVRVGGGQWELATRVSAGWSTWSYSFDSRILPDGNIEIQVAVYDDQLANSTRAIVLVVDNSGGFPWSTIGIGLFVAILLATVVVYLLARKRKRGDAREPVQTRQATDEPAKLNDSDSGELTDRGSGQTLASTEGVVSERASSGWLGTQVYECPECHTIVGDLDRFCPGCGAEFEA